MNLTDNDPRLTAYALGEMPLEEMAEMEQLLKEQPELQKEVASVDALSVMLASGLNKPEAVKLSPSQRSAIYQSGRSPKAEDVESTYKKNLAQTIDGDARCCGYRGTWLCMAQQHERPQY